MNIHVSVCRFDKARSRVWVAAIKDKMNNEHPPSWKRSSATPRWRMLSVLLHRSAMFSLNTTKVFSKCFKALIFASNEDYFDFPVRLWMLTEKWTSKKKVRMTELESGSRRRFRVAYLAAVLPSHHSCLSETESRSPSPWSAGRLQLPVCPRILASSFRRSSPKRLRFNSKILHYRAERWRKWSLLYVRDTFCCRIKDGELIRQIPVKGEKKDRLRLQLS